MSRIPETWQALESAGWEFLVRKLCRECGRTIEFWKSPSPTSKNYPLERAKETGTYLSHYAICPANFRKPKPVVAEEPKKVAAVPAKAPQGKLF